MLKERKTWIFTDCPEWDIYFNISLECAQVERQNLPGCFAFSMLTQLTISKTLMFPCPFSQMMISNFFKIPLDIKAAPWILCSECGCVFLPQVCHVTVLLCYGLHLDTQGCVKPSQTLKQYFYFLIWFWVALADLPNPSRDLSSRDVFHFCFESQRGGGISISMPKGQHCLHAGVEWRWAGPEWSGRNCFPTTQALLCLLESWRGP